jgi:hypothetical protein
MTHFKISEDAVRDVLQRFPELAVYATEAENIEAIQRRYVAATAGARSDNFRRRRAIRR